MYRKVPVLTVLLVVCSVVVAGCGGVSHGPMAPQMPAPASDHIFLVVLENHGFGEVMGNPVMPYLNSLANAHGLAVNYFANGHPSIPNYFMMTTGNVETFDDSFTGTISDDNVVRALTSAGKTWKAYIQSLPSVGYIGPDVGPYLKRHNPFAYLSDVVNSSAQAANMVPLSQLSADLAAGSLASFIYILPDAMHDAHNCPDGGSTCTDQQKLAAADNWLKANIDPVINSPKFGNSVLAITFDEAQQTDFTNGGGQVATVLVGPHVKQGFRSTTFFQHQALLRLIMDSLKAGDMPGASASANSMAEFFQ
jgi:phosphatidylinositol-3-phosphatase